MYALVTNGEKANLDSCFCYIVGRIFLKKIVVTKLSNW